MSRPLYWPDDRIAILRRMYDEGRSYSHMGVALGISKVAALQKVKRMGWPPRAKQGRPGNPGWRRDPIPKMPRGYKVSVALLERNFSPVTIRRFSWEAEA